MTTPVSPKFIATALDDIASFEGRVALIVDSEGKLDQGGRRIDRLTKGAVRRMIAGDGFEKMKEGDSVELAWPAGMAADQLQIVKLDRRAGVDVARVAGAAIGKAHGLDYAVVIFFTKETFERVEAAIHHQFQIANLTRCQIKRGQLGGFNFQFLR